VNFYPYIVDETTFKQFSQEKGNCVHDRPHLTNIYPLNWISGNYIYIWEAQETFFLISNLFR